VDGQSCICMLEVSISPLYMSCLLGFRTVPGLWYCLLLELFLECGIVCFWNCSESVVLFVFRTVPRVWHCLFLELFRECGIVCF
jgi:hypothetical protein